MYHRRWQPQTTRSDRWKREDDAARLRDAVPQLESLHLELEEWQDDLPEPIPGTRRTRHILVERAGALFEVPCSDSKCTDGGHDLTELVLSRLQALEPSIEGDSRCAGKLAELPCGRRLHFVARARFLPKG